MNLRFYGEHIDREVKNPAFYKKIKMCSTVGEGGFRDNQSMTHVDENRSSRSG